jgi:AcrR family transcriptional regulator
MTEPNQPAATRAVILEKARELFLALGYHKTTMRNVAEAAGISTGPLYFYFRNKTEVFFHICDESFDYLIAALRRAAGENDRAGLRLRAVYYAYKDFYYQEPQRFEIMHLAINPMSGIDLPPALAARLNEKAKILGAIMEEIIRAGITRRELRPVDPCKLALYLYSVAEGIFLSSRTGMLDNCQVNLDEMIDTAIELIGIGMIEPDGCPAKSGEIYSE